MTSPKELQQLYTSAIAIVLRDADTVLGDGVVTHVVDLDEEAFLREIGPDVVRAPGHLSIGGIEGAGFTGYAEDMEWAECVISGADSVLNALMESNYSWGKPFPPCPVHPNHPLIPEVVNGKACWTCPRGDIDPIKIGQFPKVH